MYCTLIGQFEAGLLQMEKKLSNRIQSKKLFQNFTIYVQSIYDYTLINLVLGLSVKSTVTKLEIPVSHILINID